MKYPSSEWKVVGTRPIRPDGVDKVTGRALFGTDGVMPGMLWGKIKGSPHAHAKILSIDTSKAVAHPGVKAVVTAADFRDITREEALAGESLFNLRDLNDRTMAREKVLYEGHPVAAVAAISPSIAEEAVELIDVQYEVLPHVLDVEEAMCEDAPVLHDDMFTHGIDPKPTKPSNIAKKLTYKKGDVKAGFAEADVVIEGRYTVVPVHQAYIEPHACVCAYNADGQVTIFSSSQGHFMVRDSVAKLLGIDVSNIRAIPAEIGGGFGGKTNIYLEATAVILSRKSGRPVKIQMTRDEVFRVTGPTAGGVVEVKIGAKSDGTITAAQQLVKFQAGAYAGAPVDQALICSLAMYDIPNVEAVGYDVVSNRPKVGAYRAPGSPISSFGIESALDDLARKLNLDPIALREKNAARDGTKTHFGMTHHSIGFVQTLEAAKRSAHWNTPLAPNQGRGIAAGYWRNAPGGESSASIHLAADGSVSVATGNPDIGGTRASIGMMVAEVLGLPAERVRTTVADTSSIGFSFLTGGSRVTYATGLAATTAAENVVGELKKRAATMWEIEVDAVEWKNGAAHAKGGHNGSAHKPLTLEDIAKKAGRTGGPITSEASINAQGAGPACAVHICDIEVDRETGGTKIVRYTAVQDVGHAIHPSYVEGQMQGGAVQGIGWALNEGYIYGANGRLENNSFLDYRIPVASDLPMIETIMVEVPNTRHPFGVRGVGEVPIVPPLAAVANAILSATGLRMCELPISPPRLLAALTHEPNATSV